MRSIVSGQYKAALEVLRDLRRETGVTQQQLAGRLGRHQSFVAKYEAAERRLDIAEFVAVVRALGADPEAALREVLKATDVT